MHPFDSAYDTGGPREVAGAGQKGLNEICIALHDSGKASNQGRGEFVRAFCDKPGAYGYGLTIVRSIIVENHGGVICAPQNSERGHAGVAPCPLTKYWLQIIRIKET